MTVTGKELVAAFAKAVSVGDATVFVGAGLSQAAGLPGWDALIAGARKTANVPDDPDVDAPLAAEYIANSESEGFLHAAIRREIDKPVSPTPVHTILASLPIRDYWTTNYDLLVEEALASRGHNYQWIVDESDYRGGAVAGTPEKRVTKMHGSLAHGTVGRRDWQEKPVITRSDFERFEERHPITWTRLRAAWLTNSFLFLGLSFDDPNLNLLLRLSRSLPSGVDAPPHYVVFKKKTDPAAQERLQELRVADLEKSGLKVHMIDSRADLHPLMQNLEVRCRPAMLFVSGSFRASSGGDDASALTVARQIATALAGTAAAGGLAIASFGGPAGVIVSKQFRDALAADDYLPERIRFYFRKAEGKDESIPIEHRVGVAVFTQRTLDEMRAFVFPQTRAMLVVKGGTTTKAEAEVARSMGVQIIPVAATGGAAEELWNSMQPADVGLDAADELLWWSQLNADQPELAAHAATMLIRRLMFE